MYFQSRCDKMDILRQIGDTRMNLIAAADENWSIGKDGGLLAHLPGDMKFFRETTKGKVVVMGRKTLESFPDKKPLKNRINIVLTRNTDYAPEGVTICGGVEETLELLKQYNSEDIFIIGGGTVYRAFLPYCKKAYITHIFHTFPADTVFPDLDQEPGWEQKEVLGSGEDNGIRYEFRLYEQLNVCEMKGGCR